MHVKVNVVPSSSPILGVTSHVPPFGGWLVSILYSANPSASERKKKTNAFWTRFAGFFWSAWLSLNIFCCLNWLHKCTTFYQIYLVSSLALPRSILLDRTSPLFKSLPIKFLSTPSLVTLSWAWMHMMTLCKHELKMRHHTLYSSSINNFYLIGWQKYFPLASGRKATKIPVAQPATKYWYDQKLLKAFNCSLEMLVDDESR